MNPLRKLLSRALASILFVQVGGTACSQVAPIYDEFPGWGSIQLVGSSKGAVHLKTNVPEVTGRAEYSVLESRIHVDWLYEVQGLSDGPLVGSPTKARSTQSVTLSYWPTEVIALGPLRLLVAGRSPFGPTLFQVLEFEPVEHLPSAYVDSSTGETRWPELRLEVDERQTVHRTAADSGRDVGLMFRNRGRADSVFFQYHDTRDVCELRLTSPPEITPIAAKSPGPPGVTVVPGLTHYYTAAGDGDHMQKGYVYWMHTPNSTNSRYLVFEDSDRNGDVDTWTLLTDWPSEYATYTNYDSLR